MNILRNQKGVAMVEFAIALPLILLLLCGTIEFGVLFYNKQVITNASREGARAGISGIDNTAIKAIVVDYSMGKLICLNNPISITEGNVNVNPDGLNDLKVSVNVAYTFLFSQIIGLGNSINLSASTVMRNEPS
jgi:Flp pilus assembly protein TadG